MDYRQYLEVIRDESAALADAAAKVSLDTPVPTCPDWTMAKLVTHIAQVQQWANMLVVTRATERIPRTALPPAPPASEAIAWFREATRTLLETLAATDKSIPVWTWTRERSVAYWARRQAQEVAVHRWDAENAGGKPQPIAAGLAADGVDELLELIQFVPGERGGAGETIHLHCTDVPGEWLIRLGAKGLEVERMHAKGDAAARGPASDLDLFLWGRIPASALEVFGDAALVTRLQTLTTL